MSAKSPADVSAPEAISLTIVVMAHRSTRASRWETRPPLLPYRPRAAEAKESLPRVGTRSRMSGSVCVLAGVPGCVRSSTALYRAHHTRYHVRHRSIGMGALTAVARSSRHIIGMLCAKSTRLGL
eukprot:127919-Prymnesium_polylepis.1